MCLAALFSVFAGCTAKNDETETEGKAAISFVDDDGYQINLDAPAKKIISMYSAHTENLYALGAGEQVIGGHTTCIFPAEAAPKATYDYQGDPEYVIAAEPDLVLIRPRISRAAPEFVESLRNAGITVVSLYPNTLDAFPDYINKLAALAGKEEKAEELLKVFDAGLNEISDLTSKAEDKQTVFFESTEVNIRTVAEGSMPDMAIKFAGGKNIAQGALPMTEGSSIAEFGAERVLENGEGIDVYVSQRGAMNAGGNLQSISERPGFDTVSAVKNGRVYVINEKLISSPTFRYVKGVNELARFMYPEIMDDVSAYISDEPATKRDFANLITRCMHIPVYVPSSSKYYLENRDTHTYGMFEDIHWYDPDFDYIETAVYSGYVSWRKGEDGKEYFDPDSGVTREELAKTVFIAGDFSAKEANTAISDLGKCGNKRIVQILVDNGVFELDENGSFLPDKQVTRNEIIQALRFVK